MEPEVSGTESTQETKETPQEQEQKQPLEAQESPADEIQDPGQLEGRPKLKKESSGPPEGSPRWEEIYWKSKEFDRKKEEFEKKAEAEKLLIEHNKKLEEALEKLNSNVEKQTQTLQPKNEQVDADKLQLDTLDKMIADKRKEKKVAAADSDFDRANDLQDEITDLLAQRTEVKTNLTVKETSKTTVQDAEARRFEEAESRFIAENAWCNPQSPEYDPIKYGAAVQIHDDLAKQGILDHNKRFNMVREKIDQYFNTPTAPMAANPINSSAIPKKKDVDLTDEEKRVAVRMFGNMEPNQAIAEYAKQKKLMEV